MGLDLGIPLGPSWGVGALWECGNGDPLGMGAAGTAALLEADRATAKARRRKEKITIIRCMR